VSGRVAVKGASPSDCELYGWVSYSLGIVHGPNISLHDDMNDSSFFRMSVSVPQAIAS
jgi:hypothetical protein